MLIRNNTTYGDLETKRKLQFQLLDVEIANELENERRMADYKNPNKPVVVPPQYKTNAELKRDALQQQRDAIVNMESIGFDYQKSAELVAWLSSGVVNKTVEFNANVAGIKKEIIETMNPKLLDVEMMKNYLTRYFDELEVSYGHKFSKESMSATPIPQTLDELSLIMPSSDMLEGFSNDILRLANGGEIEAVDETGLIRLITLMRFTAEAIPSEDLLARIRAGLTLHERTKFVKDISSYLKRFHIITTPQFNDLAGDFANIMRRLHVDGIMDGNALKYFIKKGLKSFSFVNANDNSVSLRGLLQLLDKYTTGLEGANPYADAIRQAGENQQEIHQEAEHGINFLDNAGLNEALAENIRLEIMNEDNAILDEFGQQLPVLPSVALSKTAQKQQDAHEKRLAKAHERHIIDLQKQAEQRQREEDEQNYIDAFIGELSDTTDPNFSFEALYNFTAKIVDAKKLPEDVLGHIGVSNTKKSRSMARSNPDVMRDALVRYTQEERMRPQYDPVNKPRFKHTFPDGRLGGLGLAQQQARAAIFKAVTAENVRGGPYSGGKGLSRKVITHLEKDNREMKQLKHAFKHHLQVEKDVDSDSSDSDYSEAKKRKGKGFKPTQSITTMSSGAGAKFKHSRIKVGGGIQVPQDKPTYTHFGKYVIHMPHLLDKNVFNLKYPSLGSIPSIKPLTIGDEYKEFVLDVLDNGKINERVLRKLPEHEIHHFEKVVAGAGLTDLFKLKRGNTDTERKDLDRFNLLRGEIDCGNNNIGLIKELRALTIKFMNDGRIHQKEGMNMLVEISLL